MSRKSLIIAVVMGGAAFAPILPALAGAVTDADLRGKKICWNTGVISTYNKDGSFDGSTPSTPRGPRTSARTATRFIAFGGDPRAGRTSRRGASTATKLID
jgi:hypothetical protein